MAAKMMNPMKVREKPRAMNGKRMRAKSELNARMRRKTAPTQFGATVYRFVFMVSYLRAAMIWGMKRPTDWRGTPRQISMARKP